MKRVSLPYIISGCLCLWLVSAIGFAETIVIEGGTFYTMGPRGKLEGGKLLIKGGKIVAVNKRLKIPGRARRINATNKVITPGLFDSHTHMGLVEISLINSSDDSSSVYDRLTAAFNVLDSLNPRSTLIPINRVEGVTRVMAAPSYNKHLMGGQGAIIHLGGVNDYVVKTAAAMFALLGEDGAKIAGGSRAAALLRLREAFEDARDYKVHRNDFLRRRRRSYALSRLDLEALLPVVERKVPLVLQVHRASDIDAALRFAREQRLRIVLLGAVEAWMIAGQIAKAKVPVILHPLENRPTRFEKLGAVLENATHLHNAGVQMAFYSGDAHNARNLKQAAGNAVAYGLPWLAALRALTINPAKIWGVSRSYGSLEPGKEADVVIWDGDPLEVMTFAERVFIRGREMPTTTRQTLLRDRYLELNRKLPAVYWGGNG